MASLTAVLPETALCGLLGSRTVSVTCDLTTERMRVQGKFLRRINVICPVQSHSEKYSA